MFQIHLVLKIMILALVFSLSSLIYLYLFVIVCVHGWDSSRVPTSGLLLFAGLLNCTVCETLAPSALCVCAASGFSSPSVGWANPELRECVLLLIRCVDSLPPWSTFLLFCIVLLCNYFTVNALNFDFLSPVLESNLLTGCKKILCLFHLCSITIKRDFVEKINVECSGTKVLTYTKDFQL